MTSIEILLKSSPYIRIFFKNYRKQKDINARDLSRELGKGDSYISQIESGRIKNVDEITARRLLNKIGTDQEDIDKIVCFYFYKEPSRFNNEFMYKHNQMQLNSESDLSVSDSSSNQWPYLTKFENPEEYFKKEKEILTKLDLINVVIKRLINDDIATSEKLVTDLCLQAIDTSLPVIQREYEELNKVMGLLKADTL
ncbi:helix-turn-helix transcriptional regulator [Bacillus altitudinis]|uniref:helix-turn-helix domain-containing protein n=1 Tax=Bacillus altitudinis TaxID=293387 RepID=UPI0024A7D3BE|nr:helix-turn-helix transcriptional regulator [Bacillus altitudinis]WHF25330.1 helix-turn-helix transcriptional regulator [Bacillus altitudinis]